MKKYNSKKAQTALELAIFGSVVIFLISLIVRAVLGSTYSQNHRYKATRLALLTSFEHSEGIKFPPGDWRDGTASRNFANVLIIEDRLTAQSGKYGAKDRSPQLASGQGTHSRNLFMPIDPGEYANLPMADFFVNGIHFPLTVAQIETYGQRPVIFQQEPNHPAMAFIGCGGAPLNTVFDTVGGNPYYRFDLDRNGNPNDDGVTPANCDDFRWQWIAGSPSQIDVEEGEWTQADVDDDLYTERILGKNGSTSLYVMDFQNGDMDFSISDEEYETGARLRAGFSNQNIQLFTYSKNPLGSGDDEGTYLRVDEGKLFLTDGINERFVRNAQKKDSLDLVQRTLQLSNNTRRFCDTGVGPPVAAGSTLGNRAGWTAAIPNPVEVCCDSNPCCFSLANFSQTCMVVRPVDPVIFVRSRIIDKHGRKYITPTDNDPFVQYLR